MLVTCKTKHPVFLLPMHCKNGLFSAGTFQFSAFLRAAKERTLLSLVKELKFDHYISNVKYQCGFMLSYAATAVVTADNLHSKEFNLTH